MGALKAVVKNGRLVLDEPTDLPEGAEVELAVVHDEDDPELLGRRGSGPPGGPEGRDRAARLDDVKVKVSKRAERRIEIVDRFWRKNRFEAPDLLKEELAAAEVRLSQDPYAGKACVVRERDRSA